VLFVDNGRVERVAATCLYELPDSLRHQPFQAVEVYLGRVKPKDKDVAWTIKVRCNMAAGMVAPFLWWGGVGE